MLDVVVLVLVVVEQLLVDEVVELEVEEVVQVVELLLVATNWL